MTLSDAEHFVRSPDWTWYILFYFFFAGVSGGSYAIASLMRLFGHDADEPAARLGYYLAFVTLLPCPVLLTLDLGQPLRFWHMLVDTTPGHTGLSFKYWSPMSIGAWALLVYGGFSALSLLDAYVRDHRESGRGLPLLGGFLGNLFTAVGLLLGLFIAGYTGVLLAVSNQPVWSDSWALGGLFLASGLSAATALLTWLTRYRRPAQYSATSLARSERYFQVLELLLIAVFAVTLIPAGTLSVAFGFPWILLWFVALIGLISGLGGLGGSRVRMSGGGTAAVAVPRIQAVAPWLIVLGVLALRAAVIFSAQ
jgi:formate-dependent nitrite reductase membrane component NrfD